MPFSSVNPPVLNKGGVVDKGFPPFAAVKSLFPSVNILTLNEVEALAKEIPTTAALVRCFSNVDFPMYDLWCMDLWLNNSCIHKDFIQCVFSSAEQVSIVIKVSSILSAFVMPLFSVKGLFPLGVPVWLSMLHYE